MKPSKLIFSFLLCLATMPAQNGRRYDPWDLYHQTYCLQDIKIVGGQVTRTPIIGRDVDAYVSSLSGGGNHTHEVGSLTGPRPALIFDTPIQQKTSLNPLFPTEGCATFTFHNPPRAAFAGTITTTIKASVNDPFLPVQPQSLTNELRGVDYDFGGHEIPLTRLQETQFTMDQTHPYDSRHCDNTGVCNYSRYGTAASVAQIRAITIVYEESMQNSSHFLLNIMRGALPWDGDADNEHRAGTDSPKYFAWGIGQGDEGHRHGGGWDFENPMRVLPPTGYELQANLIYNAFKTAVLEAGCHFGLFDPDSGVIVTNLPDTYDYWKGKDVIHINCQPSWQ